MTQPRLRPGDMATLTCTRHHHHEVGLHAATVEVFVWPRLWSARRHFQGALSAPASSHPPSGSLKHVRCVIADPAVPHNAAQTPPALGGRFDCRVGPVGSGPW